MKKIFMGLVFLFSGAAHAEVTGNDLLANLQSNDPFKNMYASYYIMGIVDSESYAVLGEVWSAYDAKTKKMKPFTRDYFCIPENSTNKQSFDVVQIYLERNPATRQNNGAQLARAALVEAWACRGNKSLNPSQ